jgi:hypothetical protein
MMHHCFPQFSHAQDTAVVVVVVLDSDIDGGAAGMATGIAKFNAFLCTLTFNFVAVLAAISRDEVNLLLDKI